MGPVRPSFYQDDGCEVCPSCLACPLPLCRYDDPGGFRNWQQREKRAKAKAIIASGHSRPLVTEMAVAFGITERQVYRIMARERLTLEETNGQ